jgi:hypothetical protein
MLISRCSSELFGHKLQRKLKSHRLRAKPTCPACPGEPWGCRGNDAQWEICAFVLFSRVRAPWGTAEPVRLVHQGNFTIRCH